MTGWDAGVAAIGIVGLPVTGSSRPGNKKPASRRVSLNALIPLGNLVAMGGLEPPTPAL